MNFVHHFLKATNFRINQKSFDANYPIANDEFKGKQGDFLDFEFSAPKKVNLITLFEKGESVTDFEIHAEIDGVLKMIYKQNRISDFRVCSIPEIFTTKIRIVISGTRKCAFNTIKAYLYDLPRKERPFRKTAYLISSEYKKIDPNLLKHYNKFNLIGSAKVNSKTGEICFGESEVDGVMQSQKDFFEASLKLVRDHDKNADIVATVFSEGEMMEMITNAKSLSSIKNFLDEYNLNGISFDWEYPKNIIQWKAFDNFLVNLKETIGEKTITLAIASWLRYHFSEKALAAIDVVEVMTYDNMSRDIDGHHSEFFSDGPNAIYNFVGKGFKLSQLNLGLPFYARPVDGAGYWKDYSAEVDQMDKFTNVVHGDYIDLDWKKKEIVVKDRFYNGCQMVEDKTTFCIYANVGGIMTWQIGSDAPEEHELCLIKAVSETVKNRTK